MGCVPACACSNSPSASHFRLDPLFRRANARIPMMHPKILFLATLALVTVWTSLAADFDIKSESEFAKVVGEGAKLEKLGTDMGFLEGPTWYPGEGGFLVFSDIPGNELKKWTPEGGVTSFRKPSNNANGNTVDLQSR